MFAYRQPRYKQLFLLRQAHSEKLEYTDVIEFSSPGFDVEQTSSADRKPNKKIPQHGDAAGQAL